MAQEESIARGHKTTIAAPILKSVVARDLRTRQEQEDRKAIRDAAASRSKDEILTAAEECREVLSDILVSDEAAAARGVLVAPSEVVKDLLVQAQLAEAQLAEAVAATRAGEQKGKFSFFFSRSGLNNTFFNRPSCRLGRPAHSHPRPSEASLRSRPGILTTHPQSNFS